MARITPIDVIKGISGKYGGNSNDYFATNKSSSKIHLAKFANPYTGPSTEKQVAQRIKFTERQMAITAWPQRQQAFRDQRYKGHRSLPVGAEDEEEHGALQHHPGALQVPRRGEQHRAA